jgi:hypothetical protein
VSKLRPPAFHDIARLVGRDVDETEVKLYKYYTNPDRAFFNYRCARSYSRLAFGRLLQLEQILAGCELEHTKQGRSSNSEVTRLVWDMNSHRTVQTYELAPKYLTIRKDLDIRVAPPFYFVENGLASVFWLQPRKTYALSVGELGFLASMVKLTYLVDDFRDVGFEVLDLSAPALNKPRKPTRYDLASFRILSEEETRGKLLLFATAYDRVVARGVQRSQRTAARPRPSGPDLFDQPE